MLTRFPLSASYVLSVAAGATVTVTTPDRLDGRVSVLIVSEGKISYGPATTKTGPPTLPQIDFGLGFLAHSLGVDNYTNQYLYVPSAGVFIPSYRTGVVLVLPGTQRAQILFRDPPGVTSPPAIANQQIYATWSEGTAAPNGGTSFAGP